MCITANKTRAMPDKGDKMHRRVDWLRPADRGILAEFRRYGRWLTPAAVSLNVPYTQDYVQERCRELNTRGLLEPHGSKTVAYRITGRGEDYLDDMLTADELRGF